MKKRLAFLDANILFSACYSDRSSLHTLWQLEGIEPCTSRYAISEVENNLTSRRQAASLQDLVNMTKVYPLAEPTEVLFRKSYGLPECDQPILWAAMDLGAAYLVTGDLQHFGPLMGQIIEGVEVIRAATLIKRFPAKRSGDQVRRTQPPES